MSSRTVSNTRRLPAEYNSERSPHFMGGRLSLNADRSTVSSFEHGTHSNAMGSAASRKINYVPQDSMNSPKRHFRAANSQVNPEKDNEKIERTSFRPLPNGPGPLFPTGGLPKRNMKKQDTIVTQPRVPMKASHDLLSRELSNATNDRDFRSNLMHKSLSRVKSRSLSDVRSEEKEQYGRINSNGREINMQKARRGFSISRSPSFENVHIRRALNNSEERAMMDKLSKTNIDESSRRGDRNKDFRNNNYLDLISPSQSTCNIAKPPSGRPPKCQLDFSSEPTVVRRSVVHKEDWPERVGSSSRPRYVIRQSSDSAYESNGSTGSSSGNSSPGMSKDQHLDNSSRNPAHSRYGKGLIGLRNLGNTCFMNSILQCLRCSKKLREVLCEEGVIEQMVEKLHRSKGGLTKAFTNIVRQMWSRDTLESTLSPTVLKSHVQRYAPRFVGYSQQDSQEFLRFLLEGLHDDLNIATEKPKGGYPDTSKYCDAEQARICWEVYEKKEKSLISEYFVGQLKSTLTCTECGYRSLTFDPFWDLSLPIPTRTQSLLMSGKVSLHDCFKRFTQEETLDGDEKPTCERCKKRRKCLKQFSIERFPQILVIHLKRFSGMRYRTKLETLVEFPFELNLSNYAATAAYKKSAAQYRLFGVSNHSGGTYSGHYTAYCKHPDLNDWFCFSDSFVSKRSQSKVVSDEAYVLFYELSNQQSYL